MRLGDTVPVATTTQNPDWLSKIISPLVNLASGYLTVKQASDLAKINTERARQGLAPLDASEYATGVNVGVSNSTKNTVYIVAGTLAGVWLLTSIIKRR